MLDACPKFERVEAGRASGVKTGVLGRWVAD